MTERTLRAAELRSKRAWLARQFLTQARTQGWLAKDGVSCRWFKRKVALTWWQGAFDAGMALVGTGITPKLISDDTYWRIIHGDPVREAVRMLSENRK